MKPSLASQKLAFVDVETTGLNANSNRIIEIGIVRVEEGQVIARYEQLIDPVCRIPKFIEYHTGITNAMVRGAPCFSDIRSDIFALLSSCTFVAHNALFDYSFIATEFSRLGYRFTLPMLCTAKLSRQYFPQYRQHSLDAIIERFNFKCKNRHRALDDAKIVWEFYRKISEL